MRSDTIGFVGSVMNVSWSFSGPGRPRESITLRFGAENEIGGDIWTVISDTLPPTATQFNWTVPALKDGLFKMEVYGDGIRLVGAGQCVPEGFPIVAGTSLFRLVNQRTLTPEPDKFAPNSSAMKIIGSLMSLVFFFI
ncbi:MAG: hypothetical protein SGCHY_000147 [Lobulomycetales sp.]